MPLAPPTSAFYGHRRRRPAARGVSDPVMRMHRRLIHLAGGVVRECRRRRVVTGERLDDLLFALDSDWGSM